MAIKQARNEGIWNQEAKLPLYNICSFNYQYSVASHLMAYSIQYSIQVDQQLSIPMDNI